MEIKPIQVGSAVINDLQIQPLIIDLEKQMAGWVVICTNLNPVDGITFTKQYQIDKLEFDDLLHNMNFNYLFNLTIQKLGFEKK